MATKINVLISFGVINLRIILYESYKRDGYKMNLKSRIVSVSII